MMTEEDLSGLSDEQLRSLACRAQNELARREELLRQSIRAAFDARLSEAGLTIADIYPDVVNESAPQSEKKRGARMIARAIFMMK